MVKVFDAIVILENYMDMEEWNNFWNAFTHVNKKAAQMIPFTSDVGLDVLDISGYMNPDLAKQMPFSQNLQMTMDEMISDFVETHLDDGRRLCTLEHENKKYEIVFLMNSPQEYILLSEGKDDFFTVSDFEFCQSRVEDEEVINEVRLVYNAFMGALEHFHLADKFCSILYEDFEKTIEEGKQTMYSHCKEIFDNDEFQKELEEEGLSEYERRLKSVTTVYDMLCDDMLELVEDIVPSEWTIGKRVKYEFQPNLLELS